MGRKNGWDAGAANATGGGGGWRGDEFVVRRDGSSRHRALLGGRPFGALPESETQREWNWWDHSAVKMACPLVLPPPPPLRPRLRRVSPWHELLSISGLRPLLVFSTKEK
jgi:hypothetical protein